MAEKKTTKHPGGRPTKVTPAVIAKASEYLMEWSKLGHKVPTVEGLALYLDLHKDTLYAHTEFSDVLAELKDTQALELVNNALDGTYNAPFAKFLLSAKHDYIEKSAVENSGEQKLTVEVVKYAANEETS